MRMQECVLLLSLGLVIWILGTIYYAYTGQRVLETTPVHYWASFAISPIISAALCIFILRWRHIAPSNWAVAMVLLAIPEWSEKASCSLTCALSCREFGKHLVGATVLFFSSPTLSFSASPNSPRSLQHVRRSEPDSERMIGN